MTYQEIDNGGPLVNFTNGYNLVGSRAALAAVSVLFVSFVVTPGGGRSPIRPAPDLR